MNSNSATTTSNLEAPPHNTEAEIGLLGSIFADADYNDRTEVVEEAISVGVTAEWFFDPKHTLIWEGIRTIFSNDLAPGNMDVIQHLSKTNQIGEVGGITYINSICDRVETSSRASHFLREVKALYERRKLLKACLEVKEAAQEPILLSPDNQDPNAEIFSRLDRQIINIQDSSAAKIRSMKEIAPEAVSHIEFLKESGGQPTGVCSGLTALDAATMGFQKGEFIILAARPGMGKSALAGECARFATMPEMLESNYKILPEEVGVMVVSYEMSDVEYSKRILASLNALNLKDLQNATPEMMERVKASGEIMAQAPLYIEDDASLTIEQLYIRARQAQRSCNRNYGVELGLLIVDYIQLMPTNRAAKTRDQAIGMNSRGLKLLARKLNIPVMALSQLNRDLERERRDPRLSDLRESGSLEQDSDMVLLLGPRDSKNYQEDASPRQLKLRIAKQRNGPLRSINLDFFPDYMRMTDRIFEDGTGYHTKYGT